MIISKEGTNTECVNWAPNKSSEVVGYYKLFHKKLTDLKFLWDRFHKVNLLQDIPCLNSTDLAAFKKKISTAATILK